MPAVITILKKRWQEVLLLCVFLAGLFIPAVILFDSMPVESAKTSLSDSAVFILTAGGTLFGVLSAMLLMGFLATAWKEGTRQQDPARLLIIGRQYFWRMFRFALLINLFEMVIVQMLVTLAHMQFGFPLDKEPPAWIFYSSALIASAVIARPALLIPPLFIVTGSKAVLHAFALTKNYSIKKMAALVGLYVFCSGLSTALVDLWQKLELTGILKYSVLGGVALAAGFLMILPALAAMKYIADRNQPQETQTDESIDYQK